MASFAELPTSSSVRSPVDSRSHSLGSVFPPIPLQRKPVVVEENKPSSVLASGLLSECGCQDGDQVSDASVPKNKRFTLHETSGVHVEWSHLHLGWFAASSAFVFLVDEGLAFPFWVLKIRQQCVQNQLQSTRSLVRQVFRERGIRGFYYGYFVTCGSATPSVVLYAMAYQKFKYVFSGDSSLPPALQYMGPLIAGFIAEGVYSVLGIAPEIVGTKMQAPTPNGPKPLASDVVREILKTEGPRGFFKGLPLMLGVNGIVSGTWWLTYEHFKTAMMSLTPARLSLGSYQVEPGNLLAGSCASMCAAVAANPLDVLKTRIQMQSGHSQFSGVLDALRHLLKTDGLKGFQRGLVPQLIPRAFLGAWGSFTYELVLHLSVIRT